jgi:hypothetical protein
VRRRIIAFSLFFLLAIVCGSAARVWALTVTEHNMGNLMDADIAFTGACDSANPHVDERGLLVTTYTFSVTEVLKGDVPTPFTFTQWGAARADAERLGGVTSEGLPVYGVGSQYTIFLTCSSASGLCASKGLGYGSFAVTEDAEGKAQAINGYKNKGLFNNMPAKASKALSTGGIAVTPKEGAIPYESLRQAVKLLNQPTTSKLGKH